MKIFIIICLTMLSCYIGSGQPAYPTPEAKDYIINDFTFESKEIFHQLKIHCTTLGQPKMDSSGNIANAVLILHGTTGSGQQFLTEQFAGKLFNPGQLLDANKYYIILPDGIGHGKSSKPSDGLHMKFPAYTYNDMVRAYYRLLTEQLNVPHLKLVMGTSMGGMHTWVLGYTYPDFMDALMPFACAPAEIAGRNRMLRKIAINFIKMDPEWKEGEYEVNPKFGLTGAISSLLFMSSSPFQWHLKAPDKEKADSLLQVMTDRYLNYLDANDLIYQLDASRNYNPSPEIDKIKAPLFAINSADDEVNPPELKIMEKEIIKVRQGRYILLPITDKTVGHATHSRPDIWDIYLKELLELSSR